jgi:hypothetical protein
LIDTVVDDSDSDSDHDVDEDYIGEFREGAVIRVKLKNWVTYTDVEFRPGRV